MMEIDYGRLADDIAQKAEVLRGIRHAECKLLRDALPVSEAR
jgi:hypothetical protein